MVRAGPTHGAVGRARRHPGPRRLRRQRQLGRRGLSADRPASGMCGTVATVAWGAPGDIPVPGDYDGNGTVDIAVYRPSTGQWFIQGQATVQWGLPGDVPVPGDYDGNGIVDIAVYRPSTGFWYVRNGRHGPVGRRRRHSGARRTTTATERWTSRCIGHRLANGSFRAKRPWSGVCPATSRCLAISMATGRATSRCIGHRPASGTCGTVPQSSGALPATSRRRGRTSRGKRMRNIGRSLPAWCGRAPVDVSST